MKNIDWQNINRILVIKLRHHGDVLLTSPVFNLLKKQHPSIEVDALIFSETTDMLRDLPSLTKLYVVDRDKQRKKNSWQKFRREKKLVEKLKDRNYDLVIHLTESWRGAIICRLLKPKYSVVAKYSRRNQKIWLSSFTHHHSVSPLRHTVERHIDALRAVGIFPEQETDTKLELFVGNKDRQLVRDMLRKNGVTQDKYVLFHPTSRWMFKCWSEIPAAKVIDQLIRSGSQVVLTSGPDQREKDMVRRIIAFCEESPIDLSGKTTLKQLGALIDYSALFLGVDSVPMHISAAFGKPTVALFGPSEEKIWGPWQTPCRVLVSNDSCRPCHMDGCAGSKRSECVYRISAEEVLQSIRELLDCSASSTIKNESHYNSNIEIA